LLDDMGIGDQADKLPCALSGGQQQRAAIARATVTDPALVLADEPTGNLDSVSTQDVLSVFDRLNAEGRTVVLITHEPDVANHTKRVVQLRDGQVVEDARQAEVGALPPRYGSGRGRGVA
jgi:putative ABC transport system ATP-binding protein